MKRLLVIFFAVICLFGCSNRKSSVEPGLKLREKLLTGNGCRFTAVITADYGDLTQTFSMECTADTNGNIDFSVLEPEAISGVTGKISGDGGRLTFDDHAIAFSMLADGQIAPVSTPWIVLKTLRSGYIRACETKKDYAHLIIDDSYEEDALQLDVYLTAEHIPEQADILWRGKRYLSVSVKNFCFL